MHTGEGGQTKGSIHPNLMAFTYAAGPLQRGPAERCPRLHPGFLGYKRELYESGNGSDTRSAARPRAAVIDERRDLYA